MYMMYIQKWSFYKILPSRTHAKRLTFVKKSPFRPKQKFEVLLYLWSVPNMIPNRKKEPDLTSQERKRIISWLLDARIWKKARCGWRSGYFPGLAKTFATFFCTAVQAWCQLKRVVCGLEPAINSVRREYSFCVPLPGDTRRGIDRVQFTVIQNAGRSRPFSNFFPLTIQLQYVSFSTISHLF